MWTGSSHGLHATACSNANNTLLCADSQALELPVSENVLRNAIYCHASLYQWIGFPVSQKIAF
jgi:hypothetical protein